MMLIRYPSTSRRVNSPLPHTRRLLRWARWGRLPLRRTIDGAALEVQLHSCSECHRTDLLVHTSRSQIMPSLLLGGFLTGYWKG
jgi:hypothetical protein